MSDALAPLTTEEERAWEQFWLRGADLAALQARLHGKTPEALRQMVLRGLAHERIAHAARGPTGHLLACEWCGELTGPRLGERRELLPGGGHDRFVLCANCYTLTWVPFT